MPIDASIPLGVKTPDPMQSLSSMLGVAQGAQNLQKTQQEVQSGGIALQEKQNLQRFMSDKSNYTDADGNVDFNKAMSGVMANAPTTGLPVVQNLLTAQKQHVEATSALNQLGDDNRTRVANVLSTIKPDTDPKVVYQSLDALGQAYKGKLDPWISLAKQGYDQAAPGGTGAVADYLAKATRSVLPQPTQQDMKSGSLSAVPTKSGTVFVQNKVGADTPQGSQVGPTLPPPNQVVTNSTGRVGTVNPADNTYQEPQSAAPATPPVNLPPGESPETMKTWQGVRTKANLAASQVPEEQFNNNQIIKLTKSATMGEGGDILRGLTGRYAAVPDQVTTNGTVDYDKLQHFLALQQGALAERAGFNSDASRSIAEHQSGTAHGTPEGTASIARTNRALANGIDLYNRGQENWIKSNGNDPFKARDFQQAWSHSVDFDALRMYDAAKNAKSDPDGVTAIAHELGGVGSDRYNAAKKNYDKMVNLIRSGGK